MRKLAAALAAATTVALVGGALSAPATGAAPSSKQLTVAPLPAKSEVGKRITVKGKVASGRATVRVQRKYAGGGWQTVARTTSTKAGVYAVKVRLVRGGTTWFRAVKGAARSSARSLKVYQWLDLARQSFRTFQDSVVNVPVRIDGRRFLRSFQFGEGSGFVVATVGRLCARGEVWTGFRDQDLAAVPNGHQAGAAGIGLDANGDPVEAMPQITYAPVGPAKREAFPLTGATLVVLQAGFLGQAPDGVSGVLASPRLYCNAAELPAFHAPNIPVKSLARGLAGR